MMSDIGGVAMQRYIPTSVLLLAVVLPTIALPVEVTDCHDNVCATLEGPAQVAPGSRFELRVNGTLVEPGGFPTTAYALYRDADWNYSGSHLAILDSGEWIDGQGLVWSDHYVRTYILDGPSVPTTYTFIFGERSFGHGYHDVVVELSVEPAIEEHLAAVDVKPQSCPNPLNTARNGVVPVAVAGSADLDVRRIDPTSVRLAGVAPIHHTYQDVATPYTPYTGKQSELDCTTAGADGWLDLTLKFRSRDLTLALEDARGGILDDGEVLAVTLNAELDDGAITLRGEDILRLIVRESRRS